MLLCYSIKMKFILGGFIWLIALINLTVPLSLVLLVKLFILLVYSGPMCKRLNNNENDDVTLHPLNCGDSLVAFDTSWDKSVVNFGFVLETDGNLKVQKVRDWFSECFNLKIKTSSGQGNDDDEYPKLYSYLVKRGGHVFRACSKSSLGSLEENIVKRRLGDFGGNKEESLEEFISRWIVEPYQKDKPCWSIAVIRVASNCTAIAFKIHHALCDGYSLLHILDKLCADNGKKAPYLVKPYKEGVWPCLKQYLEAPLNLGKMGGSSPESNPFRVNGLGKQEKSYDWMFSFTSFNLGEMKKLRRKCGDVRMTAVIWTIVGGALRRFLEEEGVEVPDYILVGNTMPVPNHPAMSEKTRSKDRMCNHWVAAILQIPILEPNPYLRSQQIETELSSYLNSGLDKFTKSIVLPFIWTLPGSFLENSLGTKDMGIGGGLTSLIGADSYNFMGFRVKSVHPILATHDINPFLPLSCFTFSHGDKMELSMGANPRSIFRNQRTLDRIAKQLCQDELEKFINK